MLRPETPREREIYNAAIQEGQMQVLVELFEASDKKQVIRALWAKSMNLADKASSDTSPSKAELKAYAAGVLHVYDILKLSSPALESHNENAQTYDHKPTPMVHVSLTAEDVKMLGSRSGH